MDSVFLGFFASHIPITLLFDAQALLPKSWYPKSVVDMVSWYANTFKDPFMGDPNPPAWFKSFIVSELVFQLPFFFFAIYGIRKKLPSLRIPGIIYGAHVATTVVPILAEVLFKEYPAGVLGPQTLSERLTLAAFYAPYLLIPVAFAARLALTDSTDTKKKQ